MTGRRHEAAELALELSHEREHGAVLEVWADDLQADVSMLSPRSIGTTAAGSPVLVAAEAQTRPVLL